MSGLSGITFLDHKGKIIIKRDYRGDAPSNIPEKYSYKISEKSIRCRRAIPNPCFY